jgi:hypothetical protein
LDEVIFGNEGVNFYFSTPNQNHTNKNQFWEDHFSGERLSIKILIFG